MFDDIIRHMVPSPTSPVPHTEAAALLAEERSGRIEALRVILEVVTSWRKAWN